MGAFLIIFIDDEKHMLKLWMLVEVLEESFMHCISLPRACASLLKNSMLGLYELFYKREIADCFETSYEVT